MKLPEPYAYMAIGGSIWVHKGSPDDTALYSEAQLREALASHEAVMRMAAKVMDQAWNALHFSRPIGSRPCKQDADALGALSEAIKALEEQLKCS